MSQVTWLNMDSYQFPPLEQALEVPNGLLAAGGDLTPGRLLTAYRQGIFPWYENPQPILWWSPDPRAILFPEKIHVSRSLRKTIRRGGFRITGDQAFREVMLRCAQTPRQTQPGTWITNDMIEAYCELHRLGSAHSIETWRDDKLVGGLYGLTIGKVFFGESMFSHVTDASKLAFVCLARQLQQWGLPLIDCQVGNPHLQSLGAETIERKIFTRLLRENVDKVNTEVWPLDWTDMLTACKGVI